MNVRRENIIYYAVAGVLAVIFLGNVLLGALNGVHGYFDKAQAPLVISGNCAGLFAVAVPFILKRFGVNIAKPLIYLWWAFAFLHGVLGEALTLYYRIEFYDKLLHGVSGALIFYTALCISRSFFANKNVSHKFLVCLVFSGCAALTVGVIWELLEFLCDSIFGTNAQKFIPTDGDMFNGGFSFEELGGTDEELAEFYRNPSGYKFALMDTMLDIVVFFGSTVIAALSSSLLNLKFPYCFENTVYLKNARR